MTSIPKHIAVIMDGNGRWAQKRLLPRVAGYSRGVDSAKALLRNCIERKVEILTLFAFSSENWARPEAEVGFLMNILEKLLADEINQLHSNNVRLRVIGNLKELNLKLQAAIHKAVNLTQNNTGLCLNVALNYGGRWDILQATKAVSHDIGLGNLKLEELNEQLFEQYLSLGTMHPPDLLIRTSGEQRLSNFLLWQLAYAELYFSERLWPDFDAMDFAKALEFYSRRDRRYGKVLEHAETACS